MSGLAGPTPFSGLCLESRCHRRVATISELCEALGLAFSGDAPADVVPRSMEEARGAGQKRDAELVGECASKPAHASLRRTSADVSSAASCKDAGFGHRDISERRRPQSS